MANITVRSVKAKLADGRLKPGKTYQNMDDDQIARLYLKRCRDAGICAECYTELSDQDREDRGSKTNVCGSCAEDRRG